MNPSIFFIQVQTRRDCFRLTPQRIKLVNRRERQYSYHGSEEAILIQLVAGVLDLTFRQHRETSAVSTIVTR